MQYSYECWCGDKLDESHRAEDSECSMDCPVGGEAKCGGHLHSSVYHTGVGGEYFNIIGKCRIAWDYGFMCILKRIPCLMVYCICMAVFIIRTLAVRYLTTQRYSSK